ncbi:MAG TPA: hypothetical protein VNG53_06610 [Bacteroidia bacterium]|nr:hypothetical protein [Bacteroidia bacterium]
MKKFLLFLFLVFILGLGSCYYDNFEEISPAADLNTACDTTSAPSYSAKVKPILSNYCYSCHNSSTAGGGIVLDTYAGVQSAANSGQLVGGTAQLNGYIPMPPNTKISQCNIRQIELWVNQGALNN